MSHTPGPWRVHSMIKECIVSDTPGQRYSTTIAECSGYKPEREANARLIAAAPELLEAVEAIVAAGYSWVANDKISTALAKARGL